MEVSTLVYHRPLTACILNLHNNEEIIIMLRNPRRFNLLAITLSAITALPTVGQTVINEDFKLLPNDGALTDHFGQSVAISGTTAVIGSRDDPAGSAYLFDTTTGQEITKLNSINLNVSDFSYSVAISGSTVIVGSPDDHVISQWGGSAFLFDTTTGQQLARLLPNEFSTYQNYFGTSVAISGTTAIAGAPGRDEDGNDSAGAAYLFNTNTGQQITKLLPNDGAADQAFGRAVAISGTTVVVGAINSAYLFDTTTGQQIAKLLPNDGPGSSSFGESVAISGTTVVVGNDSDDDNGSSSGSAYLFDTITGQQIAKLLPNDGATGDRFGYSVAISGTVAAIGAESKNDNGSRSGSAYLFDTITGQQIAKLLPNDGAADDRFGNSVAISGTTVLIGADRNGDNGQYSGSAYLFTAPSPCPADFNGDGVLDFFDMSGFITAFTNMDPSGDFNGDGNFDHFDTSGFVSAFNAGCP